LGFTPAPIQKPVQQQYSAPIQQQQQFNAPSQQQQNFSQSSSTSTTQQSFSQSSSIQQQQQYSSSSSSIHKSHSQQFGGTAKPFAAPPSFVNKPQAPAQSQYVSKTPPAVSPARAKTPTPRFDSPRSGLNASPVTPGILKKQILLDAAVPIPPGGVVPSSHDSTASSLHNFSGGKSPVPFINTSAAPFGFQALPPLSVQTPETIAQVAPAQTPLVPPLQKPLPLIVNTPMPHYSSSYNNAARPFGELKDYYRPIHMDSGKKLLPPVIYTDF